MLFSVNTLEKQGPSRAKMAQSMGFPPKADQVSGVRELRCHVMKPEH
jgi:hypothetical protein